MTWTLAQAANSHSLRVSLAAWLWMDHPKMAAWTLAPEFYYRSALCAASEMPLVPREGGRSTHCATVACTFKKERFQGYKVKRLSCRRFRFHVQAPPRTERKVSWRRSETTSCCKYHVTFPHAFFLQVAFFSERLRVMLLLWKDWECEPCFVFIFNLLFCCFLYSFYLKGANFLSDLKHQIPPKTRPPAPLSTPNGPLLLWKDRSYSGKPALFSLSSWSS